MENYKPDGQDLIDENRQLRERLWEVEETLRAIQCGEIDALVIERPEGTQLYTLTGADRGYRMLVESITEGALILSSDDSIYYCNRALGEMLGLPIQQIISRKFHPYFTSECRSEIVELIEESRTAGIAKGEFLMRRNDGTLLPVNISLNSLRVEDFHGVCAVITDLSGQKRVEEELRRHRTELELLVKERTADLRREIVERKRAEEDVRGQREWLRVTLTSIGDAVIATDAAARITFLNSIAAELTGWREEEAKGKPVDEVFTVINEKTRKPGEDVVRRALREGRTALLSNHTALITRDGRETPVEDSAAPIRDAGGNIIGVVLVFHDVTDKRRAQEELRKSRDELELRVQERTAELTATVTRLEELNKELQEFAFIASHDLQEPLRKIQTFGSMLLGKHKGSLNPEGQDYMERIIKGANRMGELLRALLGYSRSGTNQLNFKSISLTEIVRDAASDLDHMIHRAKGTVEIGELPTVEADPALLRHLFQNIIENAVKYRKESAAPVVKIYSDTDGSFCRVFIEDNGIGFDECYCQQIFKPFQRLHGQDARYTGTGMGLAICRKIVARHRGDIEAKSVPGKGTAFIVRLPLQQGNAT